ncbi:alpha/beta hydrolase [Luteitalea sp. TBR-22]|uniref:alpha/beta hydrolase n=1 Tax=Luteitalea sp. TBR-22 TaxID=2802971 RepID=UPI001EF635E9|nr:alpha/beta hydrolase [Luteitalea sp. TBR-22]
MERVTFQSGSETLVGQLYLPSKVDGRLDSVVLIGPMTFQKEQAPTAYAWRLAAAGFAALVFDPRFRGESGGQPRCWEDPVAKVEDVRSAVSFLATQPSTMAGRVAGLGICQGSSAMLVAAAEDGRIAALATVAGHYRDHDGDVAWLGDAGLEQRKARGREAKAQFLAGGAVQYVAAVDPTDPTVGMPGKFVWDWYHHWADRGQWENRYAVMSDDDLLAFESITAARSLQTPWLMIHSDQSFLPQAARRHFDAAPAVHKQLSWEGQTPHLAYYDQDDLIDATVDKIVAYFRRHL